MPNKVKMIVGRSGSACEHAFRKFDLLNSNRTLCQECEQAEKGKQITFVDTVFRGEFRAIVIEAEKVVAFVPSTEDGKIRDGVVIRLHDSAAAKLAGRWQPEDRVFYYQDLDLDDLDGGYFNEHTKERISVVR